MNQAARLVTIIAMTMGIFILLYPIGVLAKNYGKAYRAYMLTQSAKVAQDIQTGSLHQLELEVLGVMNANLISQLSTLDKIQSKHEDICRSIEYIKDGVQLLKK